MTWTLQLGAEQYGKTISNTVVFIIYFFHLPNANITVKGNKGAFARLFRNLLRQMKLEHRACPCIVTKPNLTARKFIQYSLITMFPEKADFGEQLMISNILWQFKLESKMGVMEAVVKPRRKKP